MTPPETLRLPAGDAWQVRVVPNLYPALERQEVVIHSPRHVRSFADLDDGEVALVAEAWRTRAWEARAEGFSYVHAVVNEGKLAGASLAHSHSQLIWLREPPPAVVAEGDARAGILALVRDLDDRAESQAFGVEVLDGVVAFCPPAGRAPYEVLITTPAAPAGEGLDAGSLPSALLLLRNVVRRLRCAEGPVPWNAWAHASSHFHLELVPRLTVFAGLELGAGIYVNPLPPEEAARRLREAVTDPPAMPPDR